VPGGRNAAARFRRALWARPDADGRRHLLRLLVRQAPGAEALLRRRVGPRRQYRAGNRLARDAGTLPDGRAARADRDLLRELAGLVHRGSPLSRGELVDATARIDRLGGKRMKRLLPRVS